MYPAISLTGNQPATMKNCPLCFKKFNDKIALSQTSHNPKLYELCSKYLHSSLTEEVLMNQSNQGSNFCSKCFESAMQLVTLSDQLDFIQKSVSDLVLMFSLEILHRRGHVSKNNINSKEQLVEFDVSTLPNSGSWNVPTSFNDNNSVQAQVPVTSSCEFQGIISETISLDQFTDPLAINKCPTNTCNDNGAMAMVQNIKCENVQNWIDESEEVVNQNADFELPNVKEEISTSVTAIPEQTPIVKLHRLNLNNSTKNVVVIDSNGGNLNDVKNQKGKTEKTILTKSNSGSSCSYKLRRITKTTRHGQSYSELPSFPSSSQTMKRNAKAGTASISSRKLAVGDSRLPRLIKCDICDEVLKGRRLLILHKRKHKEELCFKCDFCNKGFKQRALMLNHRRLHTGEKPFMCSECGKSFASRNCLRFHNLMYHTKEKPFKCDICGKGFVQNWILERHRIVHTGEGKYNCDQCDYSTAQQCLLKGHKIKKHSNAQNNFKCRECARDFETVDLVEEHYKSDHFALDFTDDCIIQNI